MDQPASCSICTCSAPIDASAARTFTSAVGSSFSAGQQALRYGEVLIRLRGDDSDVHVRAAIHLALHLGISASVRVAEVTPMIAVRRSPRFSADSASWIALSRSRCAI